MVSPPLKRANSLPVRGTVAHRQAELYTPAPCPGFYCPSACTPPHPAHPSPHAAPFPQAAAEAVPHKGGRPKVSDRVALLKKALAGETAAAAAATTAVAGVLHMSRPAVPAVVCAADMDELPSAEDEDAVSALFELSASVC